jgi:hypothetical protein
VQGLEGQLTAQGLSDEFQTVEQLHRERGPMFAHPSEAEFARCDFYKIRWQYEPSTFPLQCDAQGRILESFTPDFYLPDQNLYIELTTQKQGLVTRKPQGQAVETAPSGGQNQAVLWARCGTTAAEICQPQGTRKP